MLALAAAGALAATPVAADPAQAAGKALMACVKHASALTPIDAAHEAALQADGLIYQEQAPDKLRSMAVTAYGTGRFAWSPSVEGDVWSVGYDKGTCMVMVIGTVVEPVEHRLADLFAIPDGWRQEPIAQPDFASRWTQYGWTANGHRLIAQMKVRPLPATPVKGLVMVTISPE